MASTWPALTVSPALTLTAVTFPDEAKLRLSVLAAATVPLPETVVFMSPRVTVAIWPVEVTADA